MHTALYSVKDHAHIRVRFHARHHLELVAGQLDADLRILDA